MSLLAQQVQGMRFGFIMHNFNIEPEHYLYLKNQCGDINHIEPFDKWKLAYDNKVNFLHWQMKKYLPENYKTVLDIGSGLGGIDILLAKGRPDVHLELVDGDTSHEVISGNIPHSNHAVMVDYLEKNGCDNFTITSPEEFKPSKKDIIISYSAWCFHIAPEVYMNSVLECCHKDTVLFLKVRRGAGYMDILQYHFDIEIIERKKKADLIWMKTL